MTLYLITDDSVTFCSFDWVMAMNNADKLIKNIELLTKQTSMKAITTIAEAHQCPPTHTPYRVHFFNWLYVIIHKYR